MSVFHNRKWDNGFLTLKSLIERDGLDALYQHEARLYQVDDKGNMKPVPIKTLAGSYHEFYRGVSKSINESAPPPVLTEDALAVIELIEVCALSSGKRSWIKCA